MLKLMLLFSLCLSFIVVCYCSVFIVVLFFSQNLQNLQNLLFVCRRANRLVDVARLRVVGEAAVPDQVRNDERASLGSTIVLYVLRLL